MNLTEEQKTKVREWAGQGDSLGAIQKKLEELYGLLLTYMDARMLVADLEISLRDKDRGPAKPAEPAPESGALVEGEAKAAKPVAGVKVSVDGIAQPNTVISGSVSFSDGERAYWAVDMMGRLALEPATPGYRPKQQDAVAFEAELRKALQQAGY